MSGAGDLTIGEVAERTGIAEPTLRAWEQRHGFPDPRRLASGHRRYSEDDVEVLRRVEADRRAGMSLASAIKRARTAAEAPEPSLYAGLRRRRTELNSFLLPKRTLIAMSHAIEDECAARADRPLLFASFQRESYYRSAESRWRELARGAEAAVVFAAFDETRAPQGGPIEVSLHGSDPMGREWSLVCEAPHYSACLAAWEPPGQDSIDDLDRRFETVWSVQPDVVREAVRLAFALAVRQGSFQLDTVSARLDQPPPASRDEMALVGALTSRMVAYVGAGPLSPYPGPRRPGAA